MDHKELIGAVEAGLDAETFLKSHTGRRLTARATAETSGLMADLLAADPDDAKAQRDLRTEIYLRNQWHHWVTELVTEGLNAQAELSQLEAHGLEQQGE